MKRWLKLTAALVTTLACSVGVAYAAVRPVPENLPEVALQNTTEQALPGDAAALESALAAPGPVRYKILVIDSTYGEDLTAYLDRVAEEWGFPGPISTSASTWAPTSARPGSTWTKCSHWCVPITWPASGTATWPARWPT